MQELKNQLSQFGLNPNEWSVVRQTEAKYKIKAIKDENFQFHGTAKIKNGKVKWQKLELVSL